MRGLLKRFWQYLALVAGVGLIAFEVNKQGPLTGESWFWVIVGGLVVVLSAVDILQRWCSVGRSERGPPDGQNG